MVVPCRIFSRPSHPKFLHILKDTHPACEHVPQFHIIFFAGALDEPDTYSASRKYHDDVWLSAKGSVSEKKKHCGVFSVHSAMHCRRPSPESSSWVISPGNDRGRLCNVADPVPKAGPELFPQEAIKDSYARSLTQYQELILGYFRKEQSRTAMTLR